MWHPVRSDGRDATESAIAVEVLELQVAEDTGPVHRAPLGVSLRTGCPEQHWNHDESDGDVERDESYPVLTPSPDRGPANESTAAAAAIQTQSERPHLLKRSTALKDAHPGSPPTRLAKTTIPAPNA